MLINRTVDGRVQEFTDLVFHGGPGETLEMRLFSLPEMIGIMESAGFVDIRMIDWSEPHLGVINEVGIHPQLMTMRKPALQPQ